MGSNRAPRDRRWLILAVIGVAQLMVVLDVTIVNIALPSAQRDLGFSDDERQWVVTAYALAFGSLLLLGGRIADLFGRKWTFIAGLLGFAGASAAGGGAQSFEALCGRARRRASSRRRSRRPRSRCWPRRSPSPPSAARRSASTPRSPAWVAAIGLLLGGALTEALDWRYCLYVSVAFAVPAAIAGTRLLQHVPAPHGDRGSMFPALLTASSGLFALAGVRPLARRHRRLGRPRHHRLSRRRAVLLVTFVALQRRRVAHPLLPLRVVADRNRGASFLAIATASAGPVRPLPLPDVLPAEHEGPDRLRDRPCLSATELLDRPDSRHRSTPCSPAPARALSCRPGCSALPWAWHC